MNDDEMISDEPEFSKMAEPKLKEPVDPAELTELEKIKIEKDIRDQVAKELKAMKVKEFREMTKLKLKAESLFALGKDDSGEDLDTIDLQLASYPKYIMLDGKVYHSGKTYTKKRSVISVLADQMDRGWRQEEARRGEKVEFMMPTQRKVLGRHGLRMQ